LAHPARQYRLFMFANTGSVHKTKHNLTFGKIGQYLAKIWTKHCGLHFGATLYIRQS